MNLLKSGEMHNHILDTPTATVVHEYGIHCTGKVGGMWP